MLDVVLLVTAMTPPVLRLAGFYPMSGGWSGGTIAARGAAPKRWRRAGAAAKSPAGSEPAGLAPGGDAVAEKYFPFISAPRFTLKEFARTPSLWFWFTKDWDDFDVPLLKD